MKAQDRLIKLSKSIVTAPFLSSISLQIVLLLFIVYKLFIIYSWVLGLHVLVFRVTSDSSEGTIYGAGDSTRVNHIQDN